MKWTIAAAAMLLTAPAHAEVVSSGPHGFRIRNSVELPIPPAAAYQAFGNVGKWWDKEHTFSGAASNLSLSLTPGGCFCERLPNGGGVEHMRVTYVDPGKRVLLTGSLGPLLFAATAGVMDVTFAPSGGGTTVTMDYRAAGFAEGGADKAAPLVDQVLGGQLARFKSDKSPGR